MKIRSITIRGFRGFNAARPIEFHDGLTLIYAPNSYGKTSISEALEWLLYGITSKVEEADYSKEEYKGSYRNVHLPESLAPFVKAVFVDGSAEVRFRRELEADDSTKMFVNNEETERWPLPCDPSELPRPFVLQHALKHLLLVKPDDRFQGFARLLGLDDLERIQRDVVSLCTKPQAAVPSEAEELVAAVNALQQRLDTQPSLAAISKAFRKGGPGLPDAYELVAAECKEKIPPDTEDEAVVARLREAREQAVAKVFKGDIILPGYSPPEKATNSEDDQFFLGYMTESLVEEYVGLVAIATVDHIVERAEFFNLGVRLLERTPGACPFCGQAVGDAVLAHIRTEHQGAARAGDDVKARQEQRDQLREGLANLEKKMAAYHERHIEKARPLLDLQPSLPGVEGILVPKHSPHFDAVRTAVSELQSAAKQLGESYTWAHNALKDVETSVAEAKEEAELAKVLGEALTQYVGSARSFAEVVSKHESAMSAAGQALRSELDSLAGTQDIAVLIDLLERRPEIERKFQIDAILNGLKELRKALDRHVATKMLAAISGELSTEVMKWYDEIRTTGDPDVHFGGFDMARTATGELKARRVQVKAVSYGEELVSAVSSLSESNLNALGLCVSIATNLKGESPFDFLVVDDPIQSLDADHETQFIDVIRKLVEQGKQVILLSHNKAWIDRACMGCRTLNGWYYEITGYTKEGPEVSEVPWVRWKQRLQEVDAILKDPAAGSVRLQHAEEEIRITVEEIVAELYFRHRAARTSSHSLDAAKVRKLLLECGVEAGLVDRISGSFKTTSPSHHAEADYAPNRERIQRYHSWAHELGKLLGNG